MTAGAVAHLTLHKDSYSKVSDPLAISIIYDKDQSDEYITKNNQNLQYDMMFLVQLIGKDGNATNIGSIQNANKKQVLIRIDFQGSQKAKI